MIKRRYHIDLLTEMELAIFQAIRKVEEGVADERLTKASTLLQEAKDLVSDYVDDRLYASPLGK